MKTTAPFVLILVFVSELSAQTHPLVDHHQHVFSPAAIRLISPPPAEPIAIPDDVAKFLESRGREARDTASLRNYYVEDAQLAHPGNPNWMIGRAAVIGAWQQLSRSPFRFTPIGFHQDGSTAQVVAYLTEGAGDSLRQVSHILLVLRKQSDNKWRIASESVARNPQSVIDINARGLIAHLDAAGIQRAVVLSMGYTWGNPSRNVENEYERVKAENDWASGQVAQYPDRLVGFCGLNPLESYAMTELARCAKDPVLRRGLKLHFGNSDVDLDNAEKVAQVRNVFKAANDLGMAIVVHMRTSISLRRRYGREQAEVFLNQILPAAPNVTVQIAHMAGAGGFGDVEDQVLGVFADAIARKDPRMRNVYFDVATAATLDLSAERRARLAKRIRELGVERILYGSDTILPSGPTPRDWWAAFLMLPLTKSEFETIANNVAPYMR